ncbi:MAG: hypothetical protein E7457_03735 [Ruminococcaceae bacterium]|nr:hypothetical protein [Oscillospiraceae bacterium]
MKTSPIFKILSVAVLVAVVLMFGIQSYRYVTDPFTTTLAYNSQAEETIPVNGWLVRQEEILSDVPGTLYHYLEEGEKVGVGQTIATAYSSENALQTVAQLEEQELRLQQLQFALTSYLNPDAALKLDSSITEGILSLRGHLSQGDYASADEAVSQLKAAILKRSHTYSSAEEIQKDIASVQKQIKKLEGSLSGAKSITATRSGVYSAVCDGYETVLTPEFLEDLTPAKLENIRPQDGSGKVGKLIYGSTWYYAATVSARQAEELEKGQVVQLRFAKGLNTDVQATIQSISVGENGKVAVVLRCDHYMAQTTLLRHQQAELILEGHKGIRVPANALRLDEDKQPGVYCIVGVTARFKPVTVLHQGDGYVLVQPEKSAAGTRILRPGDEVIITATQLSDGKIVG